MSDPNGAHELQNADTPEKNPILSDRAYTILEWVARVLLPALATLYAAVGALWGFPNVAQVVGTVVAVDTFLGLFLGLAQKSYDASTAKYDGSIVVMNTTDGGKHFSLELGKNPDEIASMDKITFKVLPSAISPSA